MPYSVLAALSSEHLQRPLPSEELGEVCKELVEEWVAWEAAYFVELASSDQIDKE